MSRNSAHRALSLLPSSSSAWKAGTGRATCLALGTRASFLGDSVLQPEARGALSSCNSGSSIALSSIRKAEIGKLLLASGSCMWYVLSLKRGVARYVINLPLGKQSLQAARSPEPSGFICEWSSKVRREKVSTILTPGRRGDTGHSSSGERIRLLASGWPPTLVQCCCLEAWCFLLLPFRVSPKIYIYFLNEWHDCTTGKIALHNSDRIFGFFGWVFFEHFTFVFTNPLSVEWLSSLGHFF